MLVLCVLAQAYETPRCFRRFAKTHQTMRERGVAPDESTYSNAITACGNAGKAKRAVGLLQVRSPCFLTCR